MIVLLQDLLISMLSTSDCTITGLAHLSAINTETQKQLQVKGVEEDVLDTRYFMGLEEKLVQTTRI